MSAIALQLVALLSVVGDPLGPGDHNLSLKMGDVTRSYLVHVPPKHDPTKATPVVLVLHGAGTNGAIMIPFCGLNRKADEAGFVAIYPNGTGLANLMLTWNSGGLRGKMADGKADDVAFLDKLLDDLATMVKVDSKRVYATGMSNGGMMCYCLAAELSDRIAAIAPVAGTMAIENYKPKRPVPVMHFHGAADKIVPFAGPSDRTPKFLAFKSVEETIKVCAKANGCSQDPGSPETGGRSQKNYLLTYLPRSLHRMPLEELPDQVVGRDVLR